MEGNHIFFSYTLLPKESVKWHFLPQLIIITQSAMHQLYRMKCKGCNNGSSAQFSKSKPRNGIKQVHPSLKMSLGSDKKEGGGIALPQSWPFPPAFFCTEV